MKKRLIKKSIYSGEYDVDDIIPNFDISKLIMSRDSLYGAYSDCFNYNKKSTTNAPIGVWITDDGEFVLVDGYHRVAEMLLQGIQQTDVEVWNVGYSDWKYPDEKFIVDFSLPWNGLEDFADDEILQDDYDNNYK